MMMMMPMLVLLFLHSAVVDSPPSYPLHVAVVPLHSVVIAVSSQWRMEQKEEGKEEQ